MHATPDSLAFLSNVFMSTKSKEICVPVTVILVNTFITVGKSFYSPLMWCHISKENAFVGWVGCTDVKLYFSKNAMLFIVLDD